MFGRTNIRPVKNGLYASSNKIKIETELFFFFYFFFFLPGVDASHVYVRALALSYS